MAQLRTRSAPPAEGRCSSTTARAPLASSSRATARRGPSDAWLGAPTFFSATESGNMAPRTAQNTLSEALRRCSGQAEDIGRG